MSSPDGTAPPDRPAEPQDTGPKLNLGPVDIRQTMHAAAEGIRDRLAKDGLTLKIVTTPDIGVFVADDRRIRQILFNLLANAVGFSPAGAIITLSAAG